jgi:3-hydroxyacyl-CoA dehydrogenase/enoyl-CoA hydratase/3-hydroxybutyryl-CoA epimerase/enoyl-CoA isomerase
MPLVEVIKTDKTSPATLAKAVSFVSSIGKTPLVVKDCAGFLVNRILFPYFFAFDLLASQGVDLQQIESTMEKFGFPMGPSLLIDVVGLDTSVHAAEVIAKAYAPRMTFATSSLLHEMTAAQWYGQKNGQGFYLHSIDAKGKPQKKWNPAVGNLVAKVKEQFALNFSGANRLLNSLQMTPEVLTDLLMLPMIFEAARCLEEKVVDSAIEVDMGLLLGLGFPAFRFGALKYGQDRGWDHLVERAHQYRELGGLYQVPEIVQQWAKDQVNLY